jgi:uncharacterized protein YecE (DUF72 family)
MSRAVEQPSLFALPPRSVEAAPENPQHHALAERLAGELRMGTMSWSFAGWKGLVYGAQADAKHLSAAGLTAYSQHPLLRAVEIDRSFYEPLPQAYFASVRDQVPEDFRFVVKAHEECTLPSYPRHARYGKKRAEHNPRFLDAGYALDAVVGPCAEGLGPKLGMLLFQFPPQDAREPLAFAERLHAFLEALPRSVPCAVELRNPELLTPAYASVLESTGVVHAHNVWGTMPSVLQQARSIPPTARKPLVVRWLMRRGDDYEGARSRFLPFTRLAEPDLGNRADIATLIAKALAHDVPAMVLVNNKAEGCAPATIFELARAILSRQESA